MRGQCQKRISIEIQNSENTNIYSPVPTCTLSFHKYSFSMSIFYQQDPPIPSKRCNCKCLASALKDAFAKCHSFRLKIPDSVPEPDEPVGDFDQEEEVYVYRYICTSTTHLLLLLPLHLPIGSFPNPFCGNCFTDIYFGNHKQVYGVEI